MRFIWILFLVPFSATAFEADVRLDKFFQLYEAGRTAKAVELIYLNNRNRKNKDSYDGVEQKQKQNELIDSGASLGRYHGFEILGKHQIGDRLSHLTYLLFHEKGPIRLEFEYYKPKDKWVLLHLNIDSNLVQELKALARKDIAGYLVKDDLNNPVKKEH